MSWLDYSAKFLSPCVISGYIILFLCQQLDKKSKPLWYFWGNIMSHLTGTTLKFISFAWWKLLWKFWASQTEIFFESCWTCFSLKTQGLSGGLDRLKLRPVGTWHRHAGLLLDWVLTVRAVSGECNMDKVLVVLANNPCAVKFCILQPQLSFAIPRSYYMLQLSICREGNLLPVNTSAWMPSVREWTHDTVCVFMHDRFRAKAAIWMEMIWKHINPMNAANKQIWRTHFLHCTFGWNDTI